MRVDPHKRAQAEGTGSRPGLSSDRLELERFLRRGVRSEKDTPWIDTPGALT